MIYEYTYYTTDVDNEHEDPVRGPYTTRGFLNHGFTVDIDRNDKIDLSSVEGSGDFDDAGSHTKTLEDFRDYVVNNMGYIVDDDTIELFKELISIIDDNIKERNYGRN